MTYKPASEETLHYLCSRPGAYFTPESSANYGILHCGYECASCKCNIDNTCQATIIDKTPNKAYYLFIQNHYPELLI